MTENVQQLMARMWGEIEQASRQRAVEDAKTNPEKYKLSRIFNGSANYVYFHGGWLKFSNRLEHRQFCRSTGRNIGGNYLIWEELTTYTPGGKWRKTERVNFSYSDNKTEAKETSLHKRDKWRKNNPGYTEFSPINSKRKRVA